MSSGYQTPNHKNNSFSRTNIQTIAQRIGLMRELKPDVHSIAEICSGDCLNQWQAYQNALSLNKFIAVDIDPDIVKMNQQRGINCVLGDALDRSILRSLLDYEIIFFGPPLSINCEGHEFVPFQQVSPSYREFMSLLYNELRFDGMVVCIGGKETTLGDWQWLYEHVQSGRPEVGLRLIHYSTSTITGRGEPTPSRLKYVEGWFSTNGEDSWEIRESEGNPPLKKDKGIQP